MKRPRQSQQSGVALVVTVIVVAMLAVVSVAMMQSTSVDRLSSRSVANYYRAQLAAQSGLAEAMALIQQNANNFAYVSGSEPQGVGYRTFMRQLQTNGGNWAFAGARVFLDSGEPGDDEGAARFILTGSIDEPALEQTAAWKDMAVTNSKPGETNRYAFWVDDGSAKQNLAWWGGEQAPDKGNSLTNLAQLKPFIGDLNGQSPVALADGALGSIVAARTMALTNIKVGSTNFDTVALDFDVPTVSTINLLDTSLGDRVNSFFYALSSASGATTPAGEPKLNLASLANYISNLNSDQGADSPKAQLVEDLLQSSPENAASWGGGGFSWLAESGKYSVTEQRQIVANIIDYLDEDLMPTTDSVEAPTYMGVEMKLAPDGTVRMHPYINMVGFGSVFNWFGTGELASTFLLSFMGLCNPGSVAAPTSADTYSPEIEVDFEGSVANGNLGEDPSSYFKQVLDTFPDPEVQSLEPRSGRMFPGHPIRNNEYRSVFTMPDRQPKEIVFNNIVYKIAKFRLRFKDTDGREGYVQVVPKGTSVTMVPATVTSQRSGSSVYKFTRTPSANQKDLHLDSDPRMNYENSAWVNDASDGANRSEIATPRGGVDITVDVDSENWDGAQGMPTSATWYRSTAVTNHFNRGSQSGMSSIGELGYIWTGKPWQTLNLVKTANPATADWNLLDYVTAGRRADSKGADAGSGTPIATLPYAAAGETNPPLIGGLVALGGVNVNTRKLPTITALLSASAGVNSASAQQVKQSPSASQASAYGEIAEWISNVPGLISGSNKFEREALQRGLANIAVNHSRVFTVYAAGEYRMGNVVSRAQLEADIFVGVDSSGKPKIQIIRQKFL